MNPFTDIPFLGPVIGFFTVFLIPPLLVGGYAVLLFTGINRISRRSVRLLVAVTIAVILSLAYYSFENFLRTSLTEAQFISLGFSSFFVTAFLGLTIMATGTIFAWHLMAGHIRPKRPRLLFFACFVISFFSAFLMGFAALFGPAATGNITAGPGLQVTDTLFQMFRFYEMVLFGLVVLGLYLFLQELVQRTTDMQHNYLAYIFVPFIALFLFTPLFIGCCSLSLTHLFGEIRSEAIRKIVVIAVPVTITVTGFWLTQVLGILRPEYAGLLPFALLACAVTVPLFLFEPFFDRITVNSLWVVTSALFTVVITEHFMNILPAAGFSPGSFALFVLSGIAIVFACTGQGAILRALNLYEQRTPGAGE
jgi:hypothetical protein